jgi:photosystem II stability/assembly factor-like uncharacterized protein
MVALNVAANPTAWTLEQESTIRSISSREFGPRPIRHLLASALAFLAFGVPTARAGNQVWTGTSLRAKSIEAIARDPLNSQRMWAAAFGAGVYRSLDGGATWTGYRNGLINTFVRCLAVQPRHPDSVFCGTNDGVFLSTDGGVNWSKALSTNASVRALAIHPVRTGIIYCGIFGNGVFKSLNGGKNWSQINLGLVNTNVRDIALHPTKPETVLVATGTGGGIHRSFNGGLSWAQVADTTATNGAAEQIQFDRLDPQRIYVAEADRGVIRSADGGATWVRINRGLTSLRGRALAVVDTLRYLGTDNAGVFFTTLNDTLWHPASTGLPALRVDALFAGAAAPSTVWAGTDGAGVVRSNDRGASWTGLDGGLLSTLSFSLAVAASTGAVYDGCGFGDQFWRSADQGVTWTRATSLLSHDSEHGIALDPIATNTLYVCAYGVGVYRSDDGGATFSRPDSLNLSLTNPFVRDLLAWPGESGHLFAGTGIGPFESTDGSATWVSRVGDLPASFSTRALALVPGAQATLYAGSDTSGASLGNAGVFKSVDGGGHWTKMSAGLPRSVIHALLVDAANASVVYAGTDSGAFRTADGGVLWAPASTGLPPGEVRALAQDGANGIALFCGVYGAGVFQSFDGGSSWQPVFAQSGLSNLFVRALAVDGVRRTIYAGTENGVAALSRYVVPVTAVEPQAPEPLALAASPNPARGGMVRLTASLPRAGRVRLGAYSIAGARVRELVDVEAPAGRFTWTWDGQGARGRPLPSGIYFIRLESVEGTRSIRVALLSR